jgi:hypothetical protein
VVASLPRLSRECADVVGSQVDGFVSRHTVVFDAAGVFPAIKMGHQLSAAYIAELDARHAELT